MIGLHDSGGFSDSETETPKTLKRKIPPVMRMLQAGRSTWQTGLPPDPIGRFGPISSF
jgi:hypothetical protein